MCGCSEGSQPVPKVSAQTWVPGLHLNLGPRVSHKWLERSDFLICSARSAVTFHLSQEEVTFQLGLAKIGVVSLRFEVTMIPHPASVDKCFLSRLPSPHRGQQETQTVCEADLPQDSRQIVLSEPPMQNRSLQNTD